MFTVQCSYMLPIGKCVNFNHDTCCTEFCDEYNNIYYNALSISYRPWLLCGWMWSN